MDFLYGELCQEVTPVYYSGKSTDTTTVEINNGDLTISVNVLKNNFLNIVDIVDLTQKLSDIKLIMEKFKEDNISTLFRVHIAQQSTKLMSFNFSESSDVISCLCSCIDTGERWSGEYSTDNFSTTTVHSYLNSMKGEILVCTSAPQSDNKSKLLKVVRLDQEPAEKYEGYLYIISDENDE